MCKRIHVLWSFWNIACVKFLCTTRLYIFSFRTSSIFLSKSIRKQLFLVYGSVFQAAVVNKRRLWPRSYKNYATLHTTLSRSFARRFLNDIGIKQWPNINLYFDACACRMSSRELCRKRIASPIFVHSLVMTVAIRVNKCLYFSFHIWLKIYKIHNYWL